MAHAGNDTIFALSSGALPAGVAVIRMSGPAAASAARALLGGTSLPAPRTAALRSLLDPETGRLLDSALLLHFPAPASFTGEDVVELQCHGGLAVVAGIQQALAHLGLRPAEPGEFTRRAFLAGRMDLTQAEALSDLLVAETQAQRDQALGNMGGRLRDRVESWREQLIGLMAMIEADLDFSDEGDVADNLVQTPVQTLLDDMETALRSAPVGERLRRGLIIAVIGPPNAGKSSLINILSKRDVAIVTPIPGTTRDIIEVHLDLGGVPATLLDTAGLRETDDSVEAEGIRRAKDRASTADLVLDLGSSYANAGLRVHTKVDLTGDSPGIRDGVAYISSTTGAGLADLEHWLIDWAKTLIPRGEPALITHARQAHWLEEACNALRMAAAESDAVLQAEALRSAAHALGALTGRIDPESVLDQIFSRFCIGK